MKRIAGFLAAMLALAAPSMGAAETVATEHAESRLVAETKGAAPGGTVWLALKQELQPGWHVYWKNPGDSGLPLDLQWTLPEGFTAGEILYPTPERIPVGPFANFGHHGAPAFLVPLHAPADAAPGSTARIGLKATWLICEEICVPEEGEFALDLPVTASPARDEEGAAIIAEARRALPEAYSGAPALFRAEADRVLLELDAPAGDPQTAYFIPDTEGLTEPAAPQLAAADGERLTIAAPAGFAYEPARLDRLTGVVTIEAAGALRGYEVAAAPGEVAPPRLSPPPLSPAGGGRALPLLLLAAFFGGALLNVMPCVFPIVFIKAVSLVKGAQTSPQTVRTHGVLYAAGVVATFAALGGLLLGLRAGGEALGWGFHLQSPVVVLVSAYVLFLVGLNLAGLYHVGASLQGAGAGLAEKGGAAGAFFTGVLAVFVAAPCIGPLLTAPIGAAALLPPAAAMAIFIAMALGLAAPYLAISFVPGVGRRLPKPGPWMDVFKQALAFPVFAGAAYFLWVFVQQTGSAGLARALGGALLLAVAAWLFERSKGDGGRALAVRAASLAALVGALAPLAGLGAAAPAEAARGGYGALDPQPYDEAALETLRAEGRPVFVDFTAAWCVTCQFNKATVLSRPALAAAFADRNVAFMVGDWTRRDPVITGALAAFGANGVPLYVFYPPDGPAEVLPLPLTEGAILRAVNGSSQRKESKS